MKRRGCVGCHLIEPEPGYWVDGRCPQCVDLALRSSERQSARELKVKALGPRVMDITGARFGRLTVREFSHSTEHGGAHWVCLCDCGSERVASIGNLKKGFVKSCGCLKRETNKINGSNIPMEARQRAGQKTMRKRRAEALRSGVPFIPNPSGPKSGMGHGAGNRFRRVDLTGQKLGTLKVVGFAGVDRRREAIWDCVCVECGVRTQKTGTTVRRARGCSDCRMAGVSAPWEFVVTIPAGTLSLGSYSVDRIRPEHVGSASRIGIAYNRGNGADLLLLLQSWMLEVRDSMGVSVQRCPLWFLNPSAVMLLGDHWPMTITLIGQRVSVMKDLEIKIAWEGARLNEYQRTVDSSAESAGEG